jgi:hypothetical protein
MDKVTEILIGALRQALADPSEQRLYKSGKLEGLFPGRSGSSVTAAGQALRDGLLEVVRSESKGKTTIEWVRLTPRGVDFLHEQESPLCALHDLRQALRTNQQAVPVWLDEMRTSLHTIDQRLAADAQKWQQRLAALTLRVEDTLQRLQALMPLLPEEVAQAHPWAIDAINYLDRRQSGGATTDCPLPELFSALIRHHAELSLSGFHEGLRKLRDRRVVRLEPVASLQDLPQPEFAHLEGGAIFYFVGR